MAWMLRPLYWAVWASPERRARKLLEFAQVEANGGRDLVRAAELTPDPVLRRRFLAHARDEARHAELFRSRGIELNATFRAGRTAPSRIDWLAPGERSLDDLRVEAEKDEALLAFIHLSETAAARDFAIYHSVLGRDPMTRDVFDHILRDEVFHMRYSLAELDRIAPGRRRSLLWKARLRRFWNAYLRLATGLAGLIAGLMLTIQYFLLLPPFALLAKRAARHEKPSWVEIPNASADDGEREY